MLDSTCGTEVLQHKKAAPAAKQKLPEKTRCMAFYATDLRSSPEDDTVCHALFITN